MTASSLISIGLATPDDADALRRLAALDSAGVPTGPVLLAFEGGEARAALPLQGGPAIADPFARTADLVALLDLRAARLRGTAERRPAGRRRFRSPRTRQAVTS